MSIDERKARQFKQREAAIIAAALALFRSNSLASVTIEQIAKHADIGKGTVYKHFKSKDEIYARILINLNRAMRAEINTIDNNLSFRARLDYIIEIIWRHDMQDAQFLHQLNQHLKSGNFQKNLGDKMLQAFNQLQDEDTQLYMQLLTDAQNRGEIVNEPLDTLLYCATSAIDGAILYYWQMQAGGIVTEKDSARYLKALQNFIYRALRK